MDTMTTNTSSHDETAKRHLTRVKLCGLQRPEDIVLADRYRPDYVGFVFWPGSHRYVTPKTAGELTAALDPSIRKVGVFLDEGVAQVVETVRVAGLDLVQLHGGENAEMVRRIREEAGVPIVKACKLMPADAAGPGRAGTVREAEQALTNVLAASRTADYLLLDAGDGEGRRFDWSLLEEDSCAGGEASETVLLARTVLRERGFLAGGLTAANVGEAIARLRPFAVDVSSALETNGYKDEEKVAAFMKAAGKEDVVAIRTTA